MKLKLLFILFLFYIFNIAFSSEKDENKYFIVKEINIIENNRTKDAVIISELPFKVGSEISVEHLQNQIERARQNILNTSLFNKVDIEVQYIDSNEISVYIEVSERWYMWVLPIFENAGRNFSDFLNNNDGSWYIYGIYIKHYNFRGRNEKLSLRAVTGYKDQLEIVFENPGRSNGSGWKILYRFQNDNQTAYSTKNDQQVFFKNLNNWTVRQNKIELNYYFRDGIYNNHRFIITYDDVQISDTLYSLNSLFLPLSKHQCSLLTAGYEYKFDTRNLKIYPTEGNYFETSISRVGIGLKSNYDGFFNAKILTGIYRPLFYGFYANSLLIIQGYSKKEVPYFFNAGLGYDNYLNGYEFKVIDGSFYSAIKNQLLYELIPRVDKTLDFMPISQFSKFHYALYLRLHFDAGYVYNSSPIIENKLTNKFIFGYGIGLDFVTIYDKVLTINISRTNTSKQRLFIHFNLSL